MSAPNQPSPDRPQVMQLYHSPNRLKSGLPSPKPSSTSQYTEPNRLKSALPSPKPSPSTRLLNSSCTSSAHTEAGNECLDCLDPPNWTKKHEPPQTLKQELYDHNEKGPQSPGSALSSSLSRMQLKTQTHEMSTSSSSLKSPTYSSQAYENSSPILQSWHSSNSSNRSGLTELPLLPLIQCNKPGVSFQVSSPTPPIEDDEKQFYADLPSCPNNFNLNLNDEQLVLLPTKKLNKLLKNKGLFKTDKSTKLKQKRRTLLNRGYAANGREKREEVSYDLKNDVEDMEKEVICLDAEISEKQWLLKEVQHNFKRLFELAVNNPKMDVNKHLATYKKLPY